MLQKSALLAAGLFGMTACAHSVTPATASATKSASSKETHHEPHIITTQSQAGFDDTLARAKAAIEKRGFKTFAVIDHAAGAQSIDETLAPTTLILFGNPKGGTPLLQTDSRIGLEIPLRLLIRVAPDGRVEIIHEDMAHLFHEYGLQGLDQNLAGIEAALAAVTSEAAGAE